MELRSGKHLRRAKAKNSLQRRYARASRGFHPHPTDSQRVSKNPRNITSIARKLLPRCSKSGIPKPSGFWGKHTGRASSKKDNFPGSKRLVEDSLGIVPICSDHPLPTLQKRGRFKSAPGSVGQRLGRGQPAAPSGLGVFCKTFLSKAFR